MPMMIPDPFEAAALKEKVGALEAQVECLHRLVADLLLKNQHLREAVKAQSRIETRLTIVETKLPRIRVVDCIRKPEQPRG